MTHHKTPLTVIVNDGEYEIDDQHMRLRPAPPHSHDRGIIIGAPPTLAVLIECAADGIPLVEKDGQLMLAPVLTEQEFAVKLTA